MKRKNFILLTAAGVIALGVPSFLIYDKQKKEQLKLPTHLTELYPYELMMQLGYEYMKLFPDENNQEKLIALISKATLDLDLQIKEDFSTNNIVVLDGWILSKTEGRQCALFTLSQTNLN